MNAGTIKAEMNKAIAKVSDPTTIARMEVVREYFTNPEFRAKLEEFTFKKS